MLVALVPIGVVTVTFTVPLPAGLVAMIWLFELTLNDLAALVPKSTAVAPTKLAPEILTLVPPVVGPWLGESSNTAGVTGR